MSAALDILFPDGVDGENRRAAEDMLAHAIDQYLWRLDEPGPRVSELSKLAREVEQDARILAGKVKRLHDYIDGLPMSYKLVGPMGDFLQFGEEVVRRIRSIEQGAHATVAQITDELGEDRGGRARAAVKIEGSPQECFVQDLAYIFDHFGDFPTVTEDGPFHRFCLAAYEQATGEEGTGFREAIRKVVLPIRERTQAQKKVEDRIAAIDRRVTWLKGRISTAEQYDEPRDRLRAERYKRDLKSLKPRISRLVDWMLNENFPARRPRKTSKAGNPR